MPTCAETIREISRKHLLENNGLLAGQCLRAVGNVAGTVPELTQEQGIVELPTADCSNSAVVTGFALAGRRPIYIIRYQGFLWYNAATLVNYAAKSKELWGVPCPVFVRAIGMEGNIGPVASNLHHGMVMRTPGIPVLAPMTPSEYNQAWDYFMSHDNPVFCSEHRKCFMSDRELLDEIDPEAEIALVGISAARLQNLAAAKILRQKGKKVSVINLFWLKPMMLSNKQKEALKRVKVGIVADCDYEMSVQSIAYQLMTEFPGKFLAVGLEDRTAGFSKETDNLTPSAEKIARLIDERF